VEPIHLDLGRGTNYHLFYRLANWDMFMHFTGGGIGHLSTWESTCEFKDEIQALWGMATACMQDSDDSEDDE
jgi:hypothetical protein